MYSLDLNMSAHYHGVKLTPGTEQVMAGKLKEPRVITDHRREPVCILPTGFYFDDERWGRIWQRFEEKGDALSHDDLRELFPDEPALFPRSG
jgi:hypothetical protein